MTIIGSENLNRNFYDKIIIDVDRITVTSKEEVDTIDSAHRFTDDLEDLNYEDKIREVVDYFTRYNDITGINEDWFERGRKYIAIKGSANRRLLLSTQIDSELLSRIVEKYVCNRRDFMLSSESKRVEFRGLAPECTSYHTTHDEIDVYNISTRMNQPLEFEREFFEEFLEEKFSGCEVKLESMSKKIKATSYYMGDYIVSDYSDLRVKLSCYKDFKKDLQDAIKTHNNRVRADKEEQEYLRKLQIRMKGF